MSLRPKHNESPEDWMEKNAKKEMEKNMKKMMKKRIHEDPRFAGMTVNAARQRQQREYTVGRIVANVKQKRAMALPLSPEEQWVVSNQHLFL